MFLSSPCNPVGTYNMYNIIHAHALRILYNTLYNRTDKRTAEGVYSSSTPSRSDGAGRKLLHPTTLPKLLVREVRPDYQYLYNMKYPTNIVCMYVCVCVWERDLVWVCKSMSVYFIIIIVLGFRGGKREYSLLIAGSSRFRYTFRYISLAI